MRSLRHLAIPLAVAALVLTGCSDDGDDEPDGKASASPTRDANGQSLVECTEVPDENFAGPYEAGEVGWADEQAGLIQNVLENAEEVRYCVDPSGTGHYFAILDGDHDEAKTKVACDTGTLALVDRPGVVHVAFDDKTIDCPTS